MKKLDSGLWIEVIWDDPGLVELHVRAGNGAFVATSTFYEGSKFAFDLASQLRGFPKALGETLTVSLGDLGPDTYSGGVSLELECARVGGRVWARIKVVSLERGCEHAPETAEFDLHLLPADLDRFVASLDSYAVDTNPCFELRCPD